MSNHAILAPSSAKQWLACPGSVREQAGLPDTSSEASAEGTFAHDIAARALGGTTGPTSARELIGDSGFVDADGTIWTCRPDPPVPGFDFECTLEMADYIDEYIEAVCLTTGEHPRESELLVEKQVTATSDVYGTGDALVFSPRILHVFDLKYGAGVFVEVEENPQLLCYALGALRSYPTRCEEIGTVIIHVVQPRHHLGGHSTFEIAVEDLEDWGSFVLEPGAEATKEPDAPLAAGDHCLFCKAKHRCTALRETSLQATRDAFADVDTFEVAATPPDPGELTPKQLGDALKAFPAVEQWMKAVREHAYTSANSGVKIPGFKVVEKSGHRAWNCPDDVPFAFELHGIENVSAVPKLLTPAQAEKLLPAKIRKRVMGKMTHTPDIGTALVLDADRRPARDRASAFDSITDNELDFLE